MKSRSSGGEHRSIERTGGRVDLRSGGAMTGGGGELQVGGLAEGEDVMLGEMDLVSYRHLPSLPFGPALPLEALYGGLSWFAGA